MTNTTPRHFLLPLDFLPKDKPYTLQAFSDDPNMPTVTKVRVEQHRVSSRLSWPMGLPERGGQALILTPEKP
jgi:Glycosyl-hydrolase 97 C-terminal, oligomerisation